VNQQSLDLIFIAVPLVLVLVSLTVHEAAHAWTADRLGDPTARLLGRVSFNPIVHIDPIGTLLLPAIAAFSGLPIIGWAKPVPVNMSRLTHPRRDFMLVAAAGPASNIAQAIVCAVVVRALYAGGGGSDMFELVLTSAVRINLLLAVFNLLPIPPLDGGNVLAGLLPGRAAAAFRSLGQFGFIILFALMYTGVLGDIIIPPYVFLREMLLP
jgi:Zn-dependent protease